MKTAVEAIPVEVVLDSRCKIKFFFFFFFLRAKQLPFMECDGPVVDSDCTIYYIF